MMLAGPMVNIQRLAIVYRPEKKDVLQTAQKLVRWAKAKGISIFSAPEDQPLKGTKAFRKQVKDIDLIIALGGDGTYLEAVRRLGDTAVPIIGASLGHLGFLTEADTGELLSTLELYSKGSIQPSKRTMFEYVLKKGSKVIAKGKSLNDVVLERGAFTHLIEMKVRADKDAMMELRADGLIVATPTGSTAYNLSAGGPIVHPSVSAMVVTPLCPHSLTDRSITLPDTCVIRIELMREKQKANIMADGQPVTELVKGQVLEIRKAKKEHLLLAPPHFNYLKRLNEKLQFGNR